MDETDIPPGTLARPPSIDASAFVAAGAQVVGDVRLLADASLWYNSVARGDINHVIIGARSNVQDGCVLHVGNAHPCVIGEDVTVGHGAVLHGCTVEDGCLVGMRATVLSGARIGRGSVVAAGALVREGEQVEPFSLVAGLPARLVRRLPETSYDEHLRWARKYVRLAALHRARGRR